MIKLIDMIVKAKFFFQKLLNPTDKLKMYTLEVKIKRNSPAAKYREDVRGILLEITLIKSYKKARKELQ